jgi:hypothetical protein
MIIFGPFVGIIGACCYDYYRERDIKKVFKNFLSAMLILFIINMFLFFSQAYADWEPCEKCIPLWNNESDEYLEKYQNHFQLADDIWQNIHKINEQHKYDMEDVFASAACGAILATQTKDAKSKAIAIGLAVAADYFKEKYYCHRALRRYVEDYRYEVFLMRKYKEQLLHNCKMCYLCEKVYDSENYWGVVQYKYMEYWKSWWDDLDSKANYAPGCLHTQ